jgi:hypothetical protein
MAMLDIPKVREHAQGQSIVEAIRQVTTDAGNLPAASGFGDPGQALKVYLQFVERAERLLGNVFTGGAVSEILHSPAYWSLVTSDTAAPRLLAQVLGEGERLHRRLVEVQERICRDVERFMRPNRTLVVPDTNVFLDPDNDFDKIEWKRAAGSDVDVRVVVPLIVVHELDRSKRLGNRETKLRARAGLHWLEEHLQRVPSAVPEPLHDGTSVEVYVHPGARRPDDPDGMIIEFAQELTALSGNPTVLLTRDLGMRLHSESLGLEVRQLSDDPDEVSDRE